MLFTPQPVPATPAGAMPAAATPDAAGTDAGTEASHAAARTRHEADYAATADHPDRGPRRGRCPRRGRPGLIRPAGLDSGEITGKGYVNQRQVLANRAALVEVLYAEPEPESPENPEFPAGVVEAERTA